jgi:hypothetical protein
LSRPWFYWLMTKGNPFKSPKSHRLPQKSFQSLEQA